MNNNHFCPAFIADILARCREYPDRLCCVNPDGREYTYADFLDLIERACGYILSRGIEPKSFVVIYLDNSVEYLAVEFGCWLAGCAAVPCSSAYPKSRIDAIAAHCEASVVVDAAVLDEILKTPRQKVQRLQDSIAALYYTSGSTGNPKGVIHTFETLGGRMEHFDEIYRYSEGDRFAFGLSFSFIAFTFLIPVLRAGATIVLIDRKVMTDVRRLQDELQNKKATVTVLSPSLLRPLDLSRNTYLRLILIGTEKVSGLSPQAGYRLVSLYGMTEVCVPVLFFEVDKAYDNTPIGKPIAGVEMKIASDGELCLRGAFSPGYYKDPERSAELWRGGWLHTGDIVEALPDGNCLYLNRKDWMCKINGQRVEPGDVACAVSKTEGVDDAVVKAFTAPDGHQYLVAYYTGEERLDEKIRETVSKALPVYMLPSYFVHLDEMPLNMNGKRNLLALQSPLDFASSDRVVAKAENEMQRKICKAFEHSLGIAPIGIDDDFFAMGGDSIRVIQLQANCSDLELSADCVYRYRTPRQIAKVLENESSVKEKSLKDDYPLSQSQTGIFIECMNRRGEVAYNNAFLYRLSKAIEPSRFADACTAVLRSHPGLFCTIFTDDNGVPRQKPGDSSAFKLVPETLSDKDFEKLRADLVKPFDILNDRLFRIRLICADSACWLFADFHHIVFDGTSNDIIFSEIDKAYSGQAITSETYTSFDVAADEQSARESSFMEECRKWNLEHFSDIERTSLPSPDIFSDSVTFGRADMLPGIDAEAFTRAASGLGVTENVLALSAFAYMLGSCNRALDAAFATVYNGRKDLRNSRTVSMMVKTLPVSCKWNASTTVDELLRGVKEQLAGAMSHDLFSFPEICAATAFDSRVLFTYQDELLERTSICGEKCRMTTLMENATGEPLAVQLFKQNGVLAIRTEYRSNMYSGTYIDRLMSCYVNVLKSLCKSSRSTLTSEIRLVDDVQIQNLMRIGWGKKLDYDRSETIVDLFRRNVSRRPEAVAVVAGNSRLSYSELDRKSDIIAGLLIKEGVKEDDFVALMLPRSVDFPVSYLACFKVGAAYVPLDYEYPIDRLQFMIEDSRSGVLLTTREIYEKKTGEGALNAGKVVFVDEIQTSGKVAGGVNRARPEGLAYMIYTSGTTGRPKGVMLEHRAIMNMVNWVADEMKIGPSTRIAEYASFSFDASVIELMSSLAFGGELHIMPAAIRKDLALIYKYYCDNKIECSVLTTQIGMAMLKMYDLPLRALMLGGEKLSGRYDTSVVLYNGYGPTEFTVASSFHIVDKDRDVENIPIGKAVPNTLSAVVDSLGRLLPQGIPGELVLVGPQMARGYWQRDDITAERFTPCPFVPGERMYHTGDLVRWNEDGELLYSGRIDTQVKLRGFRIELGEIESVLSKYEGVRTAVAAVKEIAGVQHLCAYYCSEKPLDEAAIRAFLASSLTDYMVPTAYVRMDAMPMTPNGKVDVRSLPVPELKAEEIVVPESDMERQLFEIVSGEFGTDAFGVTTNLISMGMTSLGAITLSLKIEKKLSVHLSSSEMLESPSIRQWAGMTGDSPKSEAAPEIFPRQDDYPLTDNQIGIYVDWEQHRGGIQYNVPILLRFEGVDADSLVAAARAFVDAHPYLNTRLKTIDGEVRQQRRGEGSVKVGKTALEREPELAFFRTFVRPFDLYGGELCRMEVFSYGTTCWLLADVHHIIFDGGSESLFIGNLVRFLNGENILPENFSAYDFSLYYKRWKESDEFASAEAYFTALLDGTVSVELPSIGGGEGEGLGTFSTSVSRDAIRSCCRKEGVTENALFLTAVAQVLHRLTRENDLSVLSVSNGRSLPALENTVGMFVQTLPVVSRVSARSASEALQAMHRQIISTVSNEKYPFTRLVEKNGLHANIIVAYQGDVLDTGLEVAGKAVDLIYLPFDTAKFPVSVNILPNADSVELAFEYDKAKFSEIDIRIFAESLAAFAINLAGAASDVPVNSIACVDNTQAGELITMGSGEKLEVDPSDTLVTMFSRSAALYPDARAVVDSDSSLSYCELDRRSDLLAQKLVECGVEKDSFVALMMPRRKEYVVAYLAVFKSGAAYLPMDYEYPPERLQYMLEDSCCKVLVTTRDIYDSVGGAAVLKTEHIIFIDSFDWSASCDNVDRSCPDGLAYMIYTSGTTGRPKGVMIEHRAAVNMVSWASVVFGVDAGTRVAEYVSFSFDASLIDLFTAITNGAELHVLSESVRKNPDSVKKYFDDNKIDNVVLPTQFAMLLLSSYKLNLKTVVMGGEKLTGHYDQTCTIVNGYGPTEFTVCSSRYFVDPRNTPDNIPIGRPVQNTLSAVVDPQGNLLPAGAAGEIVLVGPQLSRGYWNKPEMTAKRFVDCPFVPGEKMYHTGDLARWNEDGDLIFMGRIDTQVKLRGFRIELGEIESAISSFPEVTGSVAVVKEINGVQHLCGYFTAASKLDLAALRDSLAARLTSYMVPDAFVQLDAMPLTPNGKIDTKALPLPELTEKSVDEFEAPEGEAEKLIAAAFSEVLHVSGPVSRNASFFLLGGTSLQVMKVIVRLADNGLQATYGDVFKYPTPRTLAAFLDGVATGAASSPSDVSVAGSTATAPVPTVGPDGFDYSGINALLSHNSISEIGTISSLDDHPVGDVLLLGSTGYLGIHVLKELIDSYDGKIYCVIRPKSGVTCAGRLKSYLAFYFADVFASVFDSRIFVIEGDIADDSILDKLKDVKVDTVINCAANVRHFSAGDEIDRINFKGAEHLIEYCLKTGSRLIQTSTHSVSGLAEDAGPHTMCESDLFIGQKLMTKYQESKFLAERAILDAAGRGLKAKIMRLGNLMPRYSDGEFQINMDNNGFMARIRAYYLIGCVASSHLHSMIEFAPIDETASAILTLARTPDKFTVFHPFNNHQIFVDDVLSTMRKSGLDVRIVDDGVFSAKLNEALADDRLNPYITTLVAYASHNNYVVNPPSLDFTVNVLNAMDWRWSITGERYLGDVFEKLNDLLYFDK